MSRMLLLWLYLWIWTDTFQMIKFNAFVGNVPILCLLNTPKNSQNSQTHSNNSAFADELFECVWTFCEFPGVLGV